jgi:hypothetical protein
MWIVTTRVRHFVVSWTSYRSGRTGRPLKPAAKAHRRFESCLVLQFTFGHGDCRARRVESMKRFGKVFRIELQGV